MTSKQAERSRQKKAQKRKKQLATRRVPASAAPPEPGWAPAGEPEEPGDVLGALGIDDDDYLPDGQLKASAALMAMARPIIEAQTLTARSEAQSLFIIAMSAWNIEVAAVLGKAAPDLGTMLEESVPADARAVTRNMIEYFRGVKRALFPDDHRLLVSLDVVGPDGKWRINVGSVAANAPAAPAG